MRLSEERIMAPVEGSEPLKVFEAQKLGMEVPEWTLHRDRLERMWRFPTFEAALSFVIDVAQLAARANHHPDMHISYKTVRLELSTHKIGGLSRNDFIMAAQINEMAMQPA
ncbi:MAG: 4a-hydroxytetrahydrobiopterin dehydratase [Armatimonadia bacterium]